VLSRVRRESTLSPSWQVARHKHDEAQFHVRRAAGCSAPDDGRELRRIGKADVCPNGPKNLLVANGRAATPAFP